MRLPAELGWIDREREALIETLHSWSAINSGSYNLAGLRLMGERLAEAFTGLGASLEWIELQDERFIDDDGQAAQRPLGRVLRVCSGEPRPASILLLGHMDTVFGQDHPFQCCRLLPRGRLNGPGVADMKGGILVMLSALRALEASPYAGRLGWEVLITPDEEIGSPGSAVLLDQAAGRHQAALVFEPTLPDGTHAGARKGSGNFDLIVTGVAAHAGREFHLGRNAIAALAAVATRLDRLNETVPGITLNLARVVGGGALNVVPDQALLRFNVRVQNARLAAKTMARVQQIIAETHDRDGIRLALHGRFSRPPRPFDQLHEQLFMRLRQCGAELGLELRYAPTGGCCDGNNLSAAGLPNIDTLGVVGGNIHSDGEYVELDSICQRAKLCALLLFDLARTGGE